MFGDIWEGILEIFVEAQDLHHVGTNGQLAGFRSWAGFHEDRRSYGRWYQKTSQYQAYDRVRQAKKEINDIRKRYLAGERPKKWGKRWRQIRAEIESAGQKGVGLVLGPQGPGNRCNSTRDGSSIP